jgi:predicted transcriptional regulator
MIRKLDKEHLDAIQSLRDAFTQTTNVLGNIVIERHAIESRLQQLQEEEQQQFTRFNTLQQQENELLDQMRARYGEGQIDITAGIFTPTETGLVNP